MCIAISLLFILLIMLMSRHQPLVKFHLELYWIICQIFGVLRALWPPTELLGWWPQNEVPVVHPSEGDLPGFIGTTVHPPGEVEPPGVTGTVVHPPGEGTEVEPPGVTGKRTA